jgi:hypothetical protein
MCGGSWIYLQNANISDDERYERAKIPERAGELHAIEAITHERVSGYLILLACHGLGPRSMRICAHNSRHRRKKNLPPASGMSSELFAGLLRGAWSTKRPHRRHCR